MKLTHLLSLSSLVPALLLLQSPARAVPGWAQTSIDLQVPPSSCKDYVQAAIKNVTGSNSTFDRISRTTFLMTAYPQGTTGLFSYCVSNPKPVCKSAPTSTVLIVAFSDSGSSAAASWRDALKQQIQRTVPIIIDCGPVVIPVP